MQCHSCGYTNPEGESICRDCGQILLPQSDLTEGFSAVGSEDAPAHTPVRELHVSEPSLFVTKGPNEGETFLIEKPEMTIGRDTDSDIFLDDITVSRKHATVALQDGQFILKDVGSLNGTYVNQQRIDEVSIKRGDEIQIGKYRLELLTGAERRKSL